MAEPDVSEQGALPEASSETPDHPATPLTIDGIVSGLLPQVDQIVANRLNEAVNMLYRGNQGLFDAKISEIRDAFGVDRETAIAMKEAARAQLGDEGYAVVAERAKAEEKDREIARLKAEKAPPPPPEEPAGVKERNRILAEWGTPGSGLYVDQAIDYAQERGFTGPDNARVVNEAVNKLKPVTEYPDRWVGWMRAYRKEINAIEDAETKSAERQRTEVNTTRGGGGNPPDSLAEYRKALKEGGPTPSAADIDRMTAKYLAG